METTTPPPNKHEVLRNPFGKYFWWPALNYVDYTPKGQRTATRIAVLNVNRNNDIGAIAAAAQHMASIMIAKAK